MVLTIIILVTMCLSIYIGVKRGILYQLILTIGYMLSYGWALRYYKRFVYMIELTVPYGTPNSIDENPFSLYFTDVLFNLRLAFYHALSFVFVLCVGWLLTRIIGRLFKYVSEIRLGAYINLIGGAVVSFVTHYVGLFFILFVLSTLPIPFVQQQFNGSLIARVMVKYTPILSNMAYEQWVSNPKPLIDTP